MAPHRSVEAAEVERFLEKVHLIEQHITVLIAKSDLTDQEKKYILEHILIVPGISDGAIANEA